MNAEVVRRDRPAEVGVCSSLPGPPKVPIVMDPILPVFFIWDIGPSLFALLEVQVMASGMC